VSVPCRLPSRWCLPLPVLVLVLAGADEPKPRAAGDLPLVLEANFERGDLSGWDFTDPAAWTLTDQEGNHVLDQAHASRYQPAVRSPLNIALARGLDVGDFVLDLQVQSTARDYGHRDLCLFFGHQDPSHFYYVHLGKQADPNAHSIFLVDGAPRVSIAETRTKGTPWTDDWHHVRLVRETKTGLIQVFFDTMDTPIMTAHDSTFRHGRLGVGSFDDTGRFDAIRVWGAKSKPE
jgi:hypothetical protein